MPDHARRFHQLRGRDPARYLNRGGGMLFAKGRVVVEGRSANYHALLCFNAELAFQGNMCAGLVVSSVFGIKRDKSTGIGVPSKKTISLASI